jgi:hypothetical protein
MTSSGARGVTCSDALAQRQSIEATTAPFSTVYRLRIDADLTQTLFQSDSAVETEDIQHLACDRRRVRGHSQRTDAI